jgi:hypothetical protein
VIQLNVRNVAIIIIVGVLGHLAFKAAAPMLGSVPFLGSVVKTGAAA